MPSVGMRRTTRVFGIVKSADGARVLRSGRRIWPNVGEPKVKQTHDIVDRDWNCLLNNPSKSKGNKISGREISSDKFVKEEDFLVKKRRKLKTEDDGDEKTMDKMFGIVYSRKRKRFSDQSSDKSEEPLKFYCRRRKRLVDRVSPSQLHGPKITFTVDDSCEECWFLSVFGLVMRYLKRTELKLSSLASFFLSKPIKDVFANHGVRFLAEPPLSSKGVCKFFGAMNCLPLFSAEFSAFPRCFIAMHSTLFLRIASTSFVFIMKSLNPVEESDSESELASSKPCNLSLIALKLTGSNAQCKTNLGFHSFQKRRSSFRRRKARNLLHKLSSFCELSLTKLRSSVLNNPSPDSLCC